MDRISRKQRSKNMSAIRSKGNKTTEAELASLFRRNKIIGWRRHCRKNYGNPDFIFPKAELAVFADGCFWHGCKKHCIMPKSNREYWDKKIARNKARDRKVNAFYRAKGWKVLRIWEHEFGEQPTKLVRKIRSCLK